MPYRDRYQRHDEERPYRRREELYSEARRRSHSAGVPEEDYEYEPEEPEGGRRGYRERHNPEYEADWRSQYTGRRSRDIEDDWRRRYGETYDRDYDYGPRGRSRGSGRFAYGSRGYGGATSNREPGYDWRDQYGGSYAPDSEDDQSEYYGRPSPGSRYGSRGYGGTTYQEAFEYGRSGYGGRYDRPAYGDVEGADPGRATRATWWTPGPHTGRGPRGYERSSERIVEDVNDRLMQHGRIDARDIEVSVENGEVTLQGQVSSRREKRAAEDVAESVSAAPQWTQSDLR